MKPGVPTIALLCLCAAATARADEFSEFRIPAHTAWNWNGSALLSASHSGQNDGTGSNYLSGWNGSLASGALWFTDSDPRLFRVQGSFSVGGSGVNQNFKSFGAFLPGFIGQERHSQGWSQRWSFTIDDREYPWAAPIGWAASVAGAGTYDQLNERNDFDTVQPPDRQFEQLLSDVTQYQHLFQASAQVGLGRVRDATGVYDAHVLEQRLRETGAITRPLSTHARQQLVDLLYLRNSYGVVHERESKFLWSEVERLLKEDGALAGDHLDVYSVFRSIEPYIGSGVAASPDLLPSSPILRQRGGFVGPFFTGATVHTKQTAEQQVFQQSFVADSLVNETTSHFGDERTNSFDSATLGASAEYHLPLGMRWQFDGDVSSRYPAEHLFEGGNYTTLVSATAIVTDRWVVSGLFFHQRLYGDGKPYHSARDLDDWQVQYGATFVYYLEDRLQLNLDLSDNQSKTGGDPSVGAARLFSRHGDARLAITYRFLGGLNAPGLISPIRVPGPID